MVFRNIIIIGWLLIGCQSMAMKRQLDSGEESDRPNKQQKVVISLQKAIADRKFDLFQQGISEQADVNELCNGNPLFVTILDTIDGLKRWNLGCLYQMMGALVQKQESIDENNTIIDKLYDCLKMILKEKSFNPNLTDRNGVPLVGYLMIREKKALNDKDADVKKCVKKIDEQFILSGLLEAGADANAQDKQGFSPLHYIVEDRSFDIQARKKHLIMVDNLICCGGAKVNICDHLGKTPLSYCASNPRMVFLFLSHGASFDHKDQLDKKPIDYSYNPFTQEILVSNDFVKEIKKDLQSVVNQLISGRTESSIVELLRDRQQGKLRLRAVENVHVKAVIEYTADISTNIMLKAIDRQREEYNMMNLDQN